MGQRVHIMALADSILGWLRTFQYHCIYIGRSFNKLEEFHLRSWQEKILFTVTPCLRKVISAFMCQKTISMTVFLESQCFSTPWTVFSALACIGKPIFSPLVKIFLTKIYFSVHITYSFVNFTFFLLLRN